MRISTPDILLKRSAAGFGFASGAAAEVVCALGPGASSYNASADERPTSDAMEMARRMNAALSPICSPKCPQIAIFRNPTAANAMLVVTPDQAKFVYAPQFFQTVYDNYGEAPSLPSSPTNSAMLWMKLIRANSDAAGHRNCAPMRGPDAPSANWT